MNHPAHAEQGMLSNSYYAVKQDTIFRLLTSTQPGFKNIMIKKQCANNFKWSILTLFSGKNWTLNDAMNYQQHKGNSLLARILGVIMLVMFFNMAAAINSPVQAADTVTPPNIDCLFNWAQTFRSDLFSPPVSGLKDSSPYTYRYYPATNSYVGVSSADNHVYYLGPYDVSPQDVGPLSLWLAESGCGTRPYPVIFIHGLGSSAETWTAYRDYLINNGHWTFGGIPAYDPITKTADIVCDPSQPVQCTASGAGDFYTLNFSDNQQLYFDVQGGELAAIIKVVLDANPGKTKVLLVSHSMGGLAAREYLQGLARQEINSLTTIPYREDVAKLITIGTPHQGAFWAEECQNNGGIICDLLPLHIDRNSIAVEDLRPSSAALQILNDLISHPLPNISYVSIIGTGQRTLVSSTRTEEGDGIVSAISQDLVRITGTSPQKKSVPINIPFRNCGHQIDFSFIGSLGETHTCETTDISVGAEILRDSQ